MRPFLACLLAAGALATVGGTLFDVIHGGQKPDFAEDLHAHDFDVRIMVLSGEITVTRDGRPDTFRAGDHCEVTEGCQHTTKVGPEGVAYMVGKAYRRASMN